MSTKNPEGAQVDPERLAWFAMNDSGNAERLVERSKDADGNARLLWVDQGEDGGYWVAFDGQRWGRKAGAREARLFARETARLMRDEVAALGERFAKGDLPKGMTAAVADEKMIALHKWAIRSGNRTQTDNMLIQARMLLAVAEDDFDTDPLALNVRNGTLRFVLDKGAWRVRLDPHRSTDMITRLAEVDYDPDARAPRWLARLEQLQPEEDQREMMRRTHGYGLLGLRSEQKWVVAQGRGGDGKSLSYVVIAAIMGDYYRHADVQTFLKGGQKSGSDHTEDLARLSGDIRLVTCDEPPRFSTWNGKILKQVTSGTTMTVRGLREASKEMRPRFLVLCECNPFPKVDTSDDGFWRRCLPFQWPVQLPESAWGDFEEIKAALLGERSGILNWMIGGALAWLTERDLKPSARSKEVKENYRNASDPFGEWYRARCVTGDPKDPALREKGADLHADFKHYCEEELGIDGAKVPGQRAFGTQLDERQHPNRKTMGNKWRFGIRLKTPAELDGEASPQRRDGPSGDGDARPIDGLPDDF